MPGTETAFQASSSSRRGCGTSRRSSQRGDWRGGGRRVIQPPGDSRWDTASPVSSFLRPGGFHPPNPPVALWNERFATLRFVATKCLPACYSRPSSRMRRQRVVRLIPSDARRLVAAPAAGLERPADARGIHGVRLGAPRGRRPARPRAGPAGASSTLAGAYDPGAATSPGRSSGRIVCPLHTATAYSSAFSSSRTLPGQACSSSSAQRVGREAQRPALARADPREEEGARAARCPRAARAAAGSRSARRAGGSRGPRGSGPRATARARSPFVAATMRTSTAPRLGSRPRARTSRSCSTRSSFTCRCSGRSPTSSRKSVPPAAISKRPVAVAHRAGEGARARGRRARSRAALRAARRS